MVGLGTRERRAARGWTKRCLRLEACVLVSASFVGCVDITADGADGLGGSGAEPSSHAASGGRDHATAGAESSGGQNEPGGSGGIASGGRGSGGDQASGGQAAGGQHSGGQTSTGGRNATGGATAAGGVDAAGGDTSSGGEGGFGGSGDPGECVDDELADACLVPIPCSENSSPFGGGNGTELSPYRICSAAHLQAMGPIASSGKYFVLARSLDLSSVDDFATIGPAPWSPFSGKFQGAGRALVGLVIDGVGLFGEIAMGARVENLKLLDFYVTSGGEAGILAGGNQGTVTHVETSGHVEGGSSVGGIVGYHSEMWDLAGSSLSDSSSSATVDGHSQLGGIVGSASMPLSNVTASGSVWGSGDYVGGVVGQMHGGYLSLAHATGDVEGRAAVGGLVGGMDLRTYGLLGTMVDYATVDSSTANGKVTATLSGGGLVGELLRGSGIVDSSATGPVSVSADLGGSGVAGGLVGAGGGLVARSFASGMVSSDGTAGGLIGRLTGMWVVEDTYNCVPGEPCGALVQGTGTIENSYALGDVSGGLNVGGLVGSTDYGEAPLNVGSIGFTYALGVVTGGDPKGGLIGAEAAPFLVTDSYYRDQSPASGPGTPLSVADFADPSSFVGWAFDAGLWAMSEELGRPVLAWE